MRYIQCVVLAMLMISSNVGSWNVCEDISVKDWANCTCNINGENQGTFYCNGVNVSMFIYRDDDYIVNKIVISCNETLSSPLVLPKLGAVQPHLILKLTNCLPSAVPLREVIDHLEVGFIEYLYLEGKVDALPSSQLANLTDIKAVVIYRVDLSFIDPTAFGDDGASDSSITELLFNENNISQLDHMVFWKLKHLQTLGMAFNQLSTLPDDLLIHNKALIELSFQYNKLEIFSSKLLRNQVALRTLHLSHNRIKHLSGEWTGLDSLNFLDLSHNQLTSLGEGEVSVLRHLHKLETLRLYCNNLTRLYRDWTGLKSIERISLHTNKIQTFEVEIFAEVTHNLFIDLEDNNISKLTIGSRPFGVANDSTKAVVFVLIYNNPLICDCHLHSLVRYTREDPSLSNVRLEFNARGKLSCEHPPKMKNLLIKDLSLEDFTCPISDDCPQHCNCYYRPEGSYTVVNCSGVGLEKLPHSLPVHPNSSRTQMILSNNQLFDFTYSSDLWPNVTDLDLSNTSMTTFTVFNGTGPLKNLNISKNQLKSLSHDTVRHLQSLDSLSLHDNPWSCNHNRELISLIKNPLNITIYNIGQTTCTLPMKDISYNDTCLMTDNIDQ